MSEATPKISILEQRRIEAGIVKPIYKTLVAELGVERARDLIGAAIRKAALDTGRRFAQADEGRTNLVRFAQLFELWKEGNAYDMEVLQSTPEHFDFNINRCSYAEMYMCVIILLRHACGNISVQGPKESPQCAGSVYGYSGIEAIGISSFSGSSGKGANPYFL
jgi:hypothetical protein